MLDFQFWRDIQQKLLTRTDLDDEKNATNVGAKGVLMNMLSTI